MASTGWKLRSLLESNRQVRSFRELASWQSPSRKDRMLSRILLLFLDFLVGNLCPRIEADTVAVLGGAEARAQVWGFRAVGSNRKTLFVSSSRARSICSLERKSGAGVGSEGE